MLPKPNPVHSLRSSPTGSEGYLIILKFNEGKSTLRTSLVKVNKSLGFEVNVALKVLQVTQRKKNLAPKITGIPGTRQLPEMAT